MSEKDQKNDSPEPGTRDVYADLFAQAEWGALIALAERELNSEDLPTRLQARLWWVRAELKRSVLPITVLAAPLEGFLTELAGCQDPDCGASLAAESVSLVEEIVKQLESQGDSETALILLEKVQKFDRKLEPLFLRIIEGEIKRYSGALTDRERRAAEGKVAGLRELQAAIAGNRSSYGNSDSKDRREAAAKEPALKAGSSWRAAAMGVFLIFLAVLGIWIIYPKDGQLLVVSEDALIDLMEAKLQRFGPEELERAVRLSQLDRIYYQMEQSGVQQESLDTIPHDHPAGAELEKEPQAVAANSRALLNTSGPPEPPDVADAIENAKGRDTRELAAVEQAARRPEIFPERPPVIGGRKQETTVGSYVSVLVDTYVMVSPTYRGRSIGRLRGGDRVELRERKGSWLEVVLNDGRTGYILAQDATS